MDNNVALQEVMNLYVKKYGVGKGQYMMLLNRYMLQVGSADRDQTLEYLNLKRSELTDEQFEELLNV